MQFLSPYFLSTQFSLHTAYSVSSYFSHESRDLSFCHIFSTFTASSLHHRVSLCRHIFCFSITFFTCCHHSRCCRPFSSAVSNHIHVSSVIHIYIDTNLCFATLYSVGISNFRFVPSQKDIIPCAFYTARCIMSEKTLLRAS